jgi:hypothetical protein
VTRLAFLLALVGAQDIPPPLVVEGPSFSLVIARVTPLMMYGPVSICPEEAAICTDGPRWGHFDHTTTLFGRQLPADTWTLEPAQGWYDPVLAVIETSGDRGHVHVLAMAHPEGPDRIACIARAQLPAGWAPEGAAVVISDDLVCASLAGVPPPLPPIAVQVVGQSRSKVPRRGRR